MKHPMKHRQLKAERCEARCLLTALPLEQVDIEIKGCFANEFANENEKEWSSNLAARDGVDLNQLVAVGTEPQFRINQTPRLQIGNAPLMGTPSYDGFDQIEILWQTVPAGNGTEDSFVVEIRDIDATNSNWLPTDTIDQITTGVQDRIVHSAKFRDLEWSHNYEYRVQHLRGRIVVDEFAAEFRTRLRPDDTTSFTFAAYGDSAEPGAPLENFRAVQRAINASDSDFAVLLGDNIYSSGSHEQADSRFDPRMNPEATDWIASHVDYMAIGNHELFSGGQPSLDSFSTPLPEAGVNAFASPPEGEKAEFYGSFDYGIAHFVTFDSNSAELSRGDRRVDLLEQQIEYLVTDLEASAAHWKILYMHHPLLGSSKLQLYPNTNYLEIMMPRLIDAGVDLILVGDSHTYAWTYPVVALDDVDGNNEISDAEVVVENRSRTEFQKGAGPVQLISGVGGRSLRNDAFGQPYMAQAHSLRDTTLPLEFGYAEINVSTEQLTVTYVSAETGHIFGDTNQNGQQDHGEDGFSRFVIYDENESPETDLNQDGQVDVRDLDAICSALLAANQNSLFDINQDNQVNQLDYDYFLSDVLGTTAGDANLDGIVNSSDLVLVFQAMRYERTDGPTAGFAEGDWNCDGRFTTTDLVTLFQLGVYRPV